MKEYVRISIGESIDPRQDYTTTLRIPVTIHRKRLRKAVQVYHEVVSCTALRNNVCGVLHLLEKQRKTCPKALTKNRLYMPLGFVVQYVYIKMI